MANGVKLMADGLLQMAYSFWSMADDLKTGPVRHTQSAAGHGQRDYTSSDPRKVNPVSIDGFDLRGNEAVREPRCFFPDLLMLWVLDRL
jgi:hypothetical protein